MRHMAWVSGVLWVLLSVGCSTSNIESRMTVESRKVNDFFDRVYDEKVNRFPEWQTDQGIKTDYDKWDDRSEEVKLRELEITKQNLKWLQDSADYALLDPQTKISYRMAVDAYTDGIKNFKYRYYNYPVNQMFGRHTGLPSFLINMHLVSDESAAKAYVSRLQSVDGVFDQLIDGLKKRETMGVIPPQFVFPRAIESCRNIIAGIPFDASEEDSALFADFKKKVQALELTEARKEELVAVAGEALVTVVKPAYEKLIDFLEEQSGRASTDAGVWKFEDGEAFYNEKLRLTTTTDYTAAEIHDIGLSEVERIHGEIRNLMKQVQFDGDLQAFFTFMKTDDQFYYPNDDAGKQAYLDRAVSVIDDMRARLDTLFISKPKAELLVKRVEAFREKSAGGAFYSSPAPDGSRPGIYYVNLYDMRNRAKYKLEALAYHEALPGHHMQLALAQQLEGIPKFRKFGGYTAYIEGWGLYCEFIPKEMGLYTDPYSDFGRLSMELWRACRLVVDTGIHGKRWTREEGIAYYQENTSGTERSCVSMVERHIVMPSQATAYKIGMLRILELRAKAEQAMGSRFDIREFHEVVLSSGAVPLSILEQLVDAYISGK